MTCVCLVCYLSLFLSLPPFLLLLSLPLSCCSCTSQLNGVLRVDDFFQSYWSMSQIFVHMCLILYYLFTNNRFYNSLKKNNKSFEMIYISNDKYDTMILNELFYSLSLSLSLSLLSPSLLSPSSRSEMIQYMAEQQMPWVAIPHGHPLIDKLKLDFK